jgi:hypothetical protein
MTNRFRKENITYRKTICCSYATPLLRNYMRSKVEFAAYVESYAKWRPTSCARGFKGSLLNLDEGGGKEGSAGLLVCLSLLFKHANQPGHRAVLEVFWFY